MRHSRAKKKQINSSRRIPLRWIGFGISVLCFLIAIALIILLHVPQKTVTAFESATAHAGFRVKDVVVIGRDQVDRDGLMNALGAKFGDSMVAFNLKDAAKRIGVLSWVKDARVEKRWPDKIVVSLTERVPLALWQRNQQLALIDRDGQMLKTDDISSFHVLPVLVGTNAPQNAADIFSALLKYPKLYDQIAALSWVGDRRWDLHLKNGLIIKMAESSSAFTLHDQCAYLQQIEDKQALFERAIATIDMRLPDRIIIQTKGDDPATLPPSQPKI